ncbi:Na/Pi cotransporter family protein [Paracraurococcus ruber]|uniref:Na/Pi cotransporter n=1 Tax=Paracraurococcus ruber TaxID=77675 RepID=A0ABS1CSB1_9PROT|nr:Na/Pi cotransporter family protein [Paracraurococcus ruber]MBK1657172.1 Na/Pi cotransporter [Paracraurococcus ruber]TDG31118.1 Na/Pi cotransporter family protein [Paracraurococcus ruber]
MHEARLLLDLAGEAALLLCGLHMVQSGVQRAFGSRLRQALGIALGGTGRAFLAGLGVTALLQSSTATALMVGSFAAGGAVALAPALAAMLGANLGTALIVQLLSFDAAAVVPALVLAGVLAFRRGRRAMVRDLGRVAIGLGLMLLALHLMVESMAPVESSPTLRLLLAALADQPLPNLLLATMVAWAAHSSVAGVLFVASLAGSGVVAPAAAFAMVLGANLGSALNPLLEAGGDREDPARLRVPAGNLLNRAVGTALGLALLPQAVALLQALDPVPARLVANAHLGFNLAMALLALPLVPPQARLLRRLLPDRTGADPAAPRYLDEAALGTPSVALANAAREVLRMADRVEAMLQASAEAFRAPDRDAARAAARQDDAVDRLHRAVHAYLAAIPRESLGEEDSRRLREVQAFAVALEHAADVIGRDLLKHAVKRQRRGLALEGPALAEMLALHATLREQLRLAIAVFMLEDVEAARALVRGKEGLRGAERAAMRRLGEGGAAGLLLDAVRDLRRVGGHLAAVAHPLLERRGELLPSRLAEVAPGASRRGPREAALGP